MVEVTPLPYADIILPQIQMVNVTNLFYTPDSSCINFCKEQILNYEVYIKSQHLSLVMIALFSLLVNGLINNYADYIVKKTEISYRQLELIYIGTTYFAFILIAIFLVWELI